MFCSVFMLKVSFFFKVKCRCNFIQYVFFFFFFCGISHFPSHSSLPYFQSTENSGTVFTPKTLKTLRCNDFTEPEDGDTGCKTAQSLAKPPPHALKFLSVREANSQKPCPSWRTDAAFKTQLNQKNMLSVVNTPHHCLSEFALPKTTENI